MSVACSSTKASAHTADAWKNINNNGQRRICVRDVCNVCAPGWNYSVLLFRIRRIMPYTRIVCGSILCGDGGGVLQYFGLFQNAHTQIHCRQILSYEVADLFVSLRSVDMKFNWLQLRIETNNSGKMEDGKTDRSVDTLSPVNLVSVVVLRACYQFSLPYYSYFESLITFNSIHIQHSVVVIVSYEFIFIFGF